jgi:hypothetical protein
MSLAELKQEVAALNPAERAQLEGHLRLLRWKERPGLAEHLGELHRRMDAGDKVTEEQLYSLLAQRKSAQA